MTSWALSTTPKYQDPSPRQAPSNPTRPWNGTMQLNVTSNDCFRQCSKLQSSKSVSVIRHTVPDSPDGPPPTGLSALLLPLLSVHILVRLRKLVSSRRCPARGHRAPLSTAEPFALQTSDFASRVGSSTISSWAFAAWDPLSIFHSSTI